MKRILGTFGASLLGWLALGGQLWAQQDGDGIIAVPEIDATGALTGLALLAGVVALVAERKRSKK